MKFRFFAIAMLALAGCQSEKPATGKVLAEINGQCAAYGFTPGTDAFAACVYQADQNRIDANRQKRMAFAMAMQNAGAQMQANANNQMMINAMNRPRNCTSRMVGTTLQTQCY